MNSKILVVAKDATSFRNNNGTFYRRSLYDAVYNHPSKLCFIRNVENESIQLAGDDLKTNGVWNKVIWTDIDVKQVFIAKGWIKVTNREKVVTNKAKCDEYINTIEEYFKHIISDKLECGYFMMRSSSGYGFHLFSYFDKIIIDGEEVKVDVSNSQWLYSAIGMYISNLIYTQIKYDMVICKDEKFKEVARMICEYEEKADDKQKIFDLHSINLTQNISLSPYIDTIWENPNFGEFTLIQDELNDLYDSNTKSSKVVRMHLKTTKDFDVNLNEVNNYDGYYNFTHTQRYSLANTAVDLFGLDKAIEIINTIVDKKHISETIADAYTADRNNKEGNKLGLEILEHYDIIKKNEVEVSQSIESEETKEEFDEEITIEKGKHLSDYFDGNWIKNNKIIELVAPVGSGKSYAENNMVQWARDNGMDVVILKHTISLCYQEAKELKTDRKEICNSKTRKNMIKAIADDRVVIATYEQFNKHYSALKGSTLIICDEAGEFYTAEYRESFDETVKHLKQMIVEKNNFKIIMMTGTQNYETMALNPYTIHFKKEGELNEVNVKIYQSENGGNLAHLKEYIAKVMDEEGPKLVIWAYANCDFVERYGIKCDLFAKDNVEVVEEVRVNGWTRNEKLMVSAYGMVGNNFFVPKDTKVYVFAEDAVDANQGLGRARNRENVKEYNLILCPANVNDLNIDGYLPFDWFLEEEKVDVNKIQRRRMRYSDKMTDLGFEDGKVSIDKYRTENSIEWESKARANRRYNSQMRVYEMRMKQNGFKVKEGEIERVNGDDIEMSIKDRNRFPVKLYYQACLAWKDVEIAKECDKIEDTGYIPWGEVQETGYKGDEPIDLDEKFKPFRIYKTPTDKKMKCGIKSLVRRIKDYDMEKYWIEHTCTYDKLDKIIDYVEDSKYQQVTLDRFISLVKIFDVRNEEKDRNKELMWLAALYLETGIESDGRYKVKNGQCRWTLDDLCGWITNYAIPDERNKGMILKYFKDTKAKIHQIFGDQELVQWFIDNVNTGEEDVEEVDLHKDLTLKLIDSDCIKDRVNIPYICRVIGEYLYSINNKKSIGGKASKKGTNTGKSNRTNSDKGNSGRRKIQYEVLENTYYESRDRKILLGFEVGDIITKDDFPMVSPATYNRWIKEQIRLENIKLL